MVCEKRKCINFISWKNTKIRQHSVTKRFTLFQLKKSNTHAQIQFSLDFDRENKIAFFANPENNRDYNALNQIKTRKNDFFYFKQPFLCTLFFTIKKKTANFVGTILAYILLTLCCWISSMSESNEPKCDTNLMRCTTHYRKKLHRCSVNSLTGSIDAKDTICGNL